MTDKLTISDMREMLESKKKGAQVRLTEDGKGVELIGKTMEKLREEIAEGMEPVVAESIGKIVARDMGKLEKGVKDAMAELEKRAEEVRPIEVNIKGVKTKLKGVRHANFEHLLMSVQVGQPTLLVGPAGTGKTHSAAQIAEVLGLDFYSISVGAQTSKSDLVGYMHAGGDYVETQFRRAYEHGGVFLLDEADAGNSNVLILLNAALSNGYMAFPDKMVQAHEDFRLIASANTFGHGASRQYVGRNQLDAATLDRFTVLTWDIDARVETAMAGDQQKWYKVVLAVRHEAIDVLQLRVVISPRATKRGAELLAAGMQFEQVLDMALCANLPGDSQDALRQLARTVWNKQ